MHALLGTTVRSVLKSYNSSTCDKIWLSCISANTTSKPTHREESLAVFSVVLMMILGFTLLCSGLALLFRGRRALSLSLGRYRLYPAVRILLRVTFDLFLPLLSTVFALAQERGDWPTGLLLALLWMMLIELIRKKVQAMVVLPTDGSSFSRSIGRFTMMDYADEVAHLTWTGYLVYSNVNKKTKSIIQTMFATLWSIGMLTLVQRAAITYKVSRSFHSTRNPLLISVYMQHVIGKSHDEEDGQPSIDNPGPGDEEDRQHATDNPDAGANAIASRIMRTCRFVVAKEKRLVALPPTSSVTIPSDSTSWYGPGVGKVVRLDIDRNNIHELVTVAKIWTWGQPGHLNADLFSPERRPDLENWCLSFSLFKMLRRRFEKYPMVEVGTRMARELMLEGLLNLPDNVGRTITVKRPFQVLRLELHFLANYYQAAEKVVMSQPVLFFINFALSMLFVAISLLLVLMATIKEATCLLCSPLHLSHHHFKLYVYLCITFALLIALIVIESSEFLTSCFSNWNMVRLVCTYGMLPSARKLSRKFLYYIIAFRFCLFTLAKLVFPQQADAKMKINQVSIVSACGPLDKLFPPWTYRVTLAIEAQTYIISTLKRIDVGEGTIGLPAARHAVFCDVLNGRNSVTEIILITHLATELFDIRQGPLEADEGGTRVVATTLSRYCMYLVAHLPALLPDDETWVSEKFHDMRNCLAKVLQQCGGCMMCTPSLPCKHRMAESLMRMRDNGMLDGTTTVHHALTMLRDNANVSWAVLATFWVELLIFLAPSDDIQGHAMAVATSGGDLITYLWTFCTHAGITRVPITG